VRRARTDETLPRVVTVCVAFILDYDPGEKSGLAVLSDQVELYAAPPKNARVHVEGTNYRARSLGGISEHCRREQAVVWRQQPLCRLSIGDLKGEKHSVWFDDEAHVRVGARPSLDYIPLKSEWQLAEHSAALGRGCDLGGNDHLLGGLDETSKVLDLHFFSSQLAIARASYKPLLASEEFRVFRFRTIKAEDLRPISDLISLKGKTALVTGSATGIGRAIAFRFAEARAALELVDINEDKLKTVKNELAEYQVAANLHRVDLYYFNLIKCTLK
jgi:hypothetical protein